MGNALCNAVHDDGHNDHGRAGNDAAADLGEFIGGFLSPVVAGVVADAQGLPAALFISAGGALVASLTALLLKETAPAVVEKRARMS